MTTDVFIKIRSRSCEDILKRISNMAIDFFHLAQSRVQQGTCEDNQPSSPIQDQVFSGQLNPCHVFKDHKIEICTYEPSTRQCKALAHFVPSGY